MSYRYTFFVLALLFVAAACSEPTLVTSDEADLFERSVAESHEGQFASGETPLFVLQSSKNPDRSQVTLCHFPNGGGVPRKITVGSKAAAQHMNGHSKDGEVGKSFDEKCEPITCPCWDRDELRLTHWTRRQDRTNHYGPGLYLGAPQGDWGYGRLRLRAVAQHRVRGSGPWCAHNGGTQSPTQIDPISPTDLEICVAQLQDVWDEQNPQGG